MNILENDVCCWAHLLIPIISILSQVCTFKVALWSPSNLVSAYTYIYLVFKTKDPSHIYVALEKEIRL